MRHLNLAFELACQFPNHSTSSLVAALPTRLRRTVEAQPAGVVWRKDPAPSPGGIETRLQKSPTPKWEFGSPPILEKHREIIQQMFAPIHRNRSYRLTLMPHEPG